MKEKNSKKEEAVKTKKFDLFKKKEIWISGVIGLVLGGVLIYLLGIAGFPGLGHESVISFKGGNVRKNQIYSELEKNYPISYILELVDKSILDKKYKLTDEQKQEVNDQVESVLNTYSSYYGYTEDEFLQENGFDSKDDFTKYMELDYKRNLYCIDYFKTLLAKEDIDKYYNDNVYGEINTKHILVKTSDDVTDEQALATANEILGKLKSGKSFDEVAEEYKDKITTENVDFDNFTESSLESAYTDASKKLEKDQYTEEAVKTSYGYHIIYCVDKADKPAFEEVENDIVEELSSSLESADQYIRYKALIKLREENKIKFNSKDLKEEYDEYCKQVGYTTESDSEGTNTIENNTVVDTTETTESNDTQENTAE